MSNNRQILQAFMDIKKCFEQSLKMAYWSKIYKFELFRAFTKSLIFQLLHSELFFRFLNFWCRALAFHSYFFASVIEYDSNELLSIGIPQTIHCKGVA